MSEPSRLDIPTALRHLRGVPQVPAERMETPEDRQARLTVIAERKAEREAADLRFRQDRFMRRLPRRYATASLSDLEPSQDVGGKVSGWLASGHQTLLLNSADPGLGKTHAAYAVAAAGLAAGLWVEVWTSTAMLAALRPSSLDESALEDVLTCGLLVLDDLGRENATPWAQEQLHHILDQRLAHGNRTIVTTNLTAREMSARYGDPLFDRLIDDAVIVKVVGKSRRKVVEW